MTEKRADGFHELVSVFEEIDLADELEFRWAEGDEDELVLGGRPIEGPASDNLVLRTLQAMRRRRPELPAVRVELHKVVPSGAGLGGGSSDAACVLRAVPRLCGDTAPWNDAAEIAAELGSDIPFFLVGGTALCTGRGEVVEPLDAVPARVFLIAKPDLSLSTAMVYSRLRLTAPRRGVQSFLHLLSEAPGRGNLECFNRLESVALEVAPEIQRFRDVLTNASGKAESDQLRWSLTGSGSAFYAVCRDLSQAESLLERLRPLELSDLHVCRSFTGS